jgi:hypothetical protein
MGIKIADPPFARRIGRMNALGMAWDSQSSAVVKHKAHILDTVTPSVRERLEV